MTRFMSVMLVVVLGVPRTRGDDPPWVTLDYIYLRRSPHARG
jgi:hypothetical protein